MKQGTPTEGGTLTIAEEIESRPQPAIYAREGYADPVLVDRKVLDYFRWSESSGWEKAAGWIACGEQSGLHRLVLGPSLVPWREEPTRPGAVVEEFGTGAIFVRDAGGSWHGPNGAVSWDSIVYPVLKSVGVDVRSRP